MVMTHISSIIKKRFSKDPLYLLMSKWKEITGDLIFKVSIPIKLKNKTLLVGVKNNVWLQELNFLKGEMIKKIQYHLPELVDLQFILNSEIRKLKKPASNGVKSKKLVEKSLSEEDISYINSILKKIHSEELKTSFENMIKKSLSKKV